MSVFIPGNADTIIDYDCVPSYSQILAAQIVNMNDNVIIPETSLKSGTIDRQHHCWIQILYVDDIMSLTYPRFLFVRYHQSFKDYHYTLNKHENGYFYIVRPNLGNSIRAFVKLYVLAFVWPFWP